MEETQKIQHDEYDFPYHYLAQSDEDRPAFLDENAYGACGTIFDIVEMFTFERPTFSPKLMLKLSKLKGMFVEFDFLNRRALREQLENRGKFDVGFTRIFAHVVAKVK